MVETFSSLPYRNLGEREAEEWIPQSLENFTSRGLYVKGAVKSWNSLQSNQFWGCQNPMYRPADNQLIEMYESHKRI